jgi:hypothetical protein
MQIHDGDDEEDTKTPPPPVPEEPDMEKTGDYNLGADIGTKIGEGHDQVEDEVK